MDFAGMAGELWPWLLSVASGVGASCLTWRLTTKSVREAEVRVLRREAAVELSVPLRQMQTLIRRHGRTDPPPSPGEVASAFVAWTTAFDQFGHRLPDRWQHVGRSVRAASGTVFGPVTFADIRPESAGEALEVPNFVWQDFGDDYIDYLLRAFLPWGDSLTDGRRIVWDFDGWLRETGRRDAPGGRNLFGDPWYLRVLGMRST